MAGSEHIQQSAESGSGPQGSGIQTAPSAAFRSEGSAVAEGGVNRQPDTDEEPLGPLMSLLSSFAAVGMFSSLTFHLALWGLAIILLPFLGIDWLEPFSSIQPPLQASLGEEEIIDRLAFVEINTQLTGDATEGPTNIEQMAQQLQQSESGWLKSAVDDIWKNQSQADDQDATANTGSLLKIPESGLAVTKGSFTAFTIPATPEPLQPYSIIIEIRLPGDISKYRISDLSGEVEGSDKYKQKLPWDSRTPYASGYPGENGRIVRLERSSVLDVTNNRAQIVVRVPGAKRLVRDVITIKSRRLREEQELELVFGRSPRSDE